MSEPVLDANDDDKRSIGNIRFLVYIIVFTVVSAKVSDYLIAYGYNRPLNHALGFAVGILAAFPIIRGYKAYYPRGSRFTFLSVLNMIVVCTLIIYGIHSAVSFLID